MTPAVLTELLSNARPTPAAATALLEVPLIEVEPGFWERAGRLRAKAVGRHRNRGLAMR